MTVAFLPLVPWIRSDSSYRLAQSSRHSAPPQAEFLDSPCNVTCWFYNLSEDWTLFEVFSFTFSSVLLHFRIEQYNVGYIIVLAQSQIRVNVNASRTSYR